MENFRPCVGALQLLAGDAVRYRCLPMVDGLLERRTAHGRVNRQRSGGQPETPVDRGELPSLLPTQEDEMKKKAKKLALAKETVRSLEDGLSTVQGGRPNSETCLICPFDETYRCP